jgi:DNA-binding LacI/PurR family transcriptional regulator
MAIKLTDIADQAGVSIATVSRIIRKGRADNGPSGHKILQIAKELGYEPNRIRKPKGLGNIMFVLAGTKQEGEYENLIYSFASFYGHFLYSAEKEIRKHQGTLSICHKESGIEDIGTWIRQAIRDSNCKGVILLGGNFNRTSIEIFQERVPVVIINAIPGVSDLDSVAPDNEGGERQVVRRLVELGHRRIAFWADRDSSGRVVDHCITRLRGYQSGLEEAGLTYSRIYSEEVGTKPFTERMERGFRAYLEEQEKPTAIVCPGDAFAYRVLRLALSNGIDVPGKLSIFGFDDSDFSAHSHPQMSTVNIQRAWMGCEAVRLLVSRINGSECPPSQVTVKSELVERETSGPAPK